MKTFGERYGMSKVLITGCAGLLGAHLGRHLLNQGHEVIGIDNLQGGYEEFIDPRVTILHLDLRDRKQIDVYVEAFKPEYVYHTAAFAAVCLSSFMKADCYGHNMGGYSNLVNACVNHDVKKFIHFSSMDVYGDNCPPNGFREGGFENLLPEDTYGISKLAIEMDLKATHKQFGLDYSIVRPHNVFGIYQNIWDRYRNVLGIWIRQCLAGEDITVYGDGLQKRAFSHVKYYMDPLEKLMTTGDQKTYNIGADNPVCLIEAANMIQGIASSRGYPSKIVHLEPRDEVKVAFADHTKASWELDFKDETNLLELLREMFTWAEQQPVRDVKSVDYEITKNLYSYWK